MARARRTSQALLLIAVGLGPIHHAGGQVQGAGSERIALPNTPPIVIAHRGASGYLPEHTLAAYSTAVLQGADFIELDLVSTRDGHLVARHDNVLNLTTDVADAPEFHDRQTDKIVDGRVVSGWFSEDFTLEELRSLRAIERLPLVRPANARFDGRYGVPTLEEVIAVIQALEIMLAKDVGLYIELKHPTYFDDIGLPMEAALARVLRDSGYHEAHHGVFLQSFEVESLRRLARVTDLRRVQLLSGSGQPYDLQITGDALTYAAMATADGLREIATYADGVGPAKYAFLIPLDRSGNLAVDDASDFVAHAHAAGLLVHPYTFRAENQYLPVNLRSSSDVTELGAAAQEIAAFLALGIDGFFTDHADIGVAARDRHVGVD